MSFPPESFEQVFSNTCAAGYRNSFVVVPEFRLQYRDRIERTKIADVVWLVPRAYEIDEYGLPTFRVVAAFEIEGFNVSRKTILSHLRAYKKMTPRYGPIPCYVPLYSKATHRPGYGDDEDIVEDCISERKALAESQMIVSVCDAGDRKWLPAAVTRARALRTDYL